MFASLSLNELTPKIMNIPIPILSISCSVAEFKMKNKYIYSRVSNNSVDTLIKTALDFPWWLAYLIPPRLSKFSKFSILYIPTDVILRCLTRYRATRSFVHLFWRILPVLTVRESPSNQ